MRVFKKVCQNLIVVVYIADCQYFVGLNLSLILEFELSSAYLIRIPILLENQKNILTFTHFKD